MDKPWHTVDEINVYVENDNIYIPATTLAKMIGVNPRYIMDDLQNFFVQPQNTKVKLAIAIGSLKPALLHLRRWDESTIDAAVRQLMSKVKEEGAAIVSEMKIRISLDKPWVHSEDIIVHIENDDMFVPVTTFAKLVGIDARSIKYELAEFIIRPPNGSVKFTIAVGTMKQALLRLGRWNELKIDAAIEEPVSKVNEERESPWVPEEEGALMNQKRISLDKPWKTSTDINIYIDEDDIYIPATALSRMVGVKPRYIVEELQDYFVKPEFSKIKLAVTLGNLKPALMHLGDWPESTIDAAIQQLVEKVKEEEGVLPDMEQTILARLDQMERKMDETLEQMGPVALAVYYNSQDFLGAVQERVKQTVKEMEPKIIERAVEARLKRELAGEEKELYEKRHKVETDKMMKQFNFGAVRQALIAPESAKKHTTDDFLAALK